jgi:hypothetical protein
MLVLAVLAVLVSATIVAGSPADAKPPGPPQLPAIAGSVRDACTGAKVAGLEVTVTQPPGPPVVPSKVGLGRFTYATLDAGTYTLQVTAPGYAPLGHPASPGVTVEQPPDPPNVPSPQAVAAGTKTKLVLAPIGGCAPV